MQRVIVYGMSNLGFRAVKLLKESGTEVIAAIGEGSEFTGMLKELDAAVESANIADFKTLRRLGLESARSIILPSEDEQFNLSAALYAMDINPGIKVVIRLFNLNLGRRLQESVKNFTVLSVSELAAPGFASSALISDPLVSFKAGDEIMCAYEIDSAGFAAKGVAEMEKDHGIKILAMGRSTLPESGGIINSGEKLCVFSNISDAKKLSGIGNDCKGPFCRLRERKAPIKRSAPLLQADRVLVNTFLAFAGILILCAGYFHFVEGLSFIDAFYYVVTMSTGAGDMDFDIRHASIITKIVGIVLVATGMSLLAMLFAIISDSLLKKRLDMMMGRRRMKSRGHVILCGVGDVGIRILQELMRLGEKVVVVEKDPEGKFIPLVRQMNAPLIISDAVLEESLSNANIAEAKSIVCATEIDMRNLEIGLNAKSLNPDIRTVLRIFDREFAEKVEGHFDIDMALSSSEIAAPAFVSAALATGMSHRVDFNGNCLVIKDAASAPPVADAKPLMLIKKGGGSLTDFSDSDIKDGDRVVYAALSRG